VANLATLVATLSSWCCAAFIPDWAIELMEDMKDSLENWRKKGLKTASGLGDYQETAAS
jgi:hypothetical protein